MASNISQTIGDASVQQSNSPGFPELVVSPLGTAWDADNRAWTIAVQVLYNGTWNASVPSTATWIKITRQFSDRLNIALEENTTGAERTANITFTTSAGLTTTFAVNQSPDSPKKWGVSVTEVVIPAAGGAVQFEVKSKPSKRWKAKLLSDWAKLQQATGQDDDGGLVWEYKYTGMGNAGFRAVAQPNTTGQDRKAKAVFIQGFLEDKIVWIKQLGVDPVGTVSPTEITGTAGQAINATATITTDSETTLTTSADWLTVSPTTLVVGENTVTVTAPATEAGAAARTATISVIAKGIVADTITVTQPATPSA